MYISGKVATAALCVIAASSVCGVLLLLKYLPMIAESLVKISESLH